MIFGQGINIKIYNNSIFTEVPYKDKEIVRLLSDKEGKLKDNKIALFVVCLRKKYIKVGEREGGGPVYIRKMEDARGMPPVASKICGGGCLEVCHIKGTCHQKEERSNQIVAIAFKLLAYTGPTSIPGSIP